MPPSTYTMKDLVKLKEQVAWLISQVKCFMGMFPSATAWTNQHSAATGNKYLKDTLVWDNGIIYKCLVDNNSAPVNNAYYWQKMGKGWLVQQEQADFDATSGPSYIRNRPVGMGGPESDPIFIAWLATDPLGNYLTSINGLNISSLNNDSGYITSSSLTPYLTISSASTTYFPIPTGTISQYIRGDGTLATLSLEQIGGSINLISDGLPGTPVTGPTSFTRVLIKSYLIPANTFAAGDTFEIWSIGSKVNTNTSFYISLNINTSNTIVGATEIGRAFTNNVNVTYMPFLRVYNFTTSTNIRGIVANSGVNLEANLIGTSVSNTTFNTEVDTWILLAVMPVTGGTADIFNIEKVIIRKNKYKVTV